MIVLGLTGSIGMGKSVAGAMFRQIGLPLHDADRAVHGLIGPRGAAVAAVGAVFPGVVDDRPGGPGAAVDRARLAERVFDDLRALECLEGILHPLVRKATRAFLRRHARLGRRLVVLDIPLLYETGGEALCDAVLVLTAPRFLQEARVLGRSGMTRKRFATILAQQMPDREKRRRADFVVKTGLSKRETLRQLQAIVTLLLGDPGECHKRFIPGRGHA